MLIKLGPETTEAVLSAVTYSFNNPLSTYNIFDSKKRSNKEKKIAKSVEEEYVCTHIERKTSSKYGGEDDMHSCKI